MQIIQIGIVFPFVYQAFDFDTGLFMRAKIYDVSSGSPVFAVNIDMPSLGDGLYGATFNPVSGKSYLVIMNAYTDGTFGTVDNLRAPGAECYKLIDASPLLALMNYAAFDLEPSLPVAAKIYKLTPLTSFIGLVEMPHVFGGVYFASFNGIIDSSYVINTAAYEDDDFLAIDTNRASGSDEFELFKASVLFNTSDLILEGQADICNPGDTIVAFTQGDDVVLNLRARQGDGSYVDLTGATFSTTMRGIDNIDVTFANAKHTADPDQVTNKGRFTLTLNPTDTDSVKIGMNNEIVTKVVIASKTVYFHGRDILTVLSKEPTP